MEASQAGAIIVLKSLNRRHIYLHLQFHLRYINLDCLNLRISTATIASQIRRRNVKKEVWPGAFTKLYTKEIVVQKNK